MTQGDLEKLAIPVQQNLGTLEARIMSDIIRRIRINGEITSAADWQINRLYQMGVSKKTIKKSIAEALNLNKKEVKKLYHDALYNEYIHNQQMYKEKGAKWIPLDKNSELQELIASVEEQTEKELKNITQSLGFAVRGPDGKIIHTPLLDFYDGTLDDAMMDIASGAFDYNTVLKRTIQTMTNSGLRTIDYESGWSNRVDVAARRAVMTGFNQLQGKINEQVAKDLKTDYFEVSWHGGARPEHQVWQGRVYSRKELETVCGLGTVTGLLGANCYHQYNAFIPGVSVRAYTDEQLERMNAEENRPKEYNGKEYTTYEALQKQRQLETVMRKQRRDIKLLKEGGASDDDVLAAKVRYRVTMGKYSDFSDKMKLPQQKERIYADGLGRMISGKEVVKPSESAIIKSDLGAFKERLRSDKNISKRYYSSLKDRFSHGSESAKAAFAKYVPRDSVIESDYEGVPGYNTVTRRISMNYKADSKNVRGAGVTWFHEHGHLIDDAAGKVSNDKEFLNLLTEDARQYRVSYGKTHGLKTWDKVDAAISLELNEMRKHSSVSDILEGVTGGNISGVAGHPDGYWDNTENITAEAFAHMFEAQFDSVRYDEMKKYFPESLSYFEKRLKEVGT